MRKLLFTIACALNVVLCFAQDKPVVAVEQFTSSGASTNYVSLIRNKVIEGIQGTGRIIVRDVESDKNLDNEASRRRQESALSDATARTGEMNTLGANYILSGNVSTVKSEWVDGTDGQKGYYKGIVKWDVKILDASNGSVHFSKSYDYSGFTGEIDEDREKAISKTCDRASRSMGDLVDDAFPIVGLILKVESTNSKNTKAETVYIDLGTAAGVTKGQQLDVYIETDIAGEIGRTLIGDLTAKEVMSASRTLCSVGKGGDKVLDAANKGQKLIVITRKAKGLGSLVRGIL